MLTTKWWAWAWAMKSMFSTSVVPWVPAGSGKLRFRSTPLAL